MRLRKLRIENFRSFADQTITFDIYTCFVGPNGAGKSNVLTALNLFFRNTDGVATDLQKLAAEDFHLKKTQEKVKITATFEELSPEAEKDFKLYVRQGKLVISAEAEWDEGSGHAEVLQYGSRHGMLAFAKFFEQNSVADKKTVHTELSKEYDLPKATTGSTMEEALHNYESEHSDLCELIPETNQFYGFTKGDNKLRKYLQWVYIPAVKDASSEQDENKNTALSRLLQRTVRSQINFDDSLSDLKRVADESYRGILEDENQLLGDIKTRIEKRLKTWAHPNATLELKWDTENEKSVVIQPPAARIWIGETGFQGDVARLGHGMQRAFLVSLLQELVGSEESCQPTLILGFEEPELYQDPPQAQHMATLLEELAETEENNSQIILTTHSPYFVSANRFESVRMVRKDSDFASIITLTTVEEVSKKLARAREEDPMWQNRGELSAKLEAILQPSQREMFFTSIVVLVEGTEDIAYISTYLDLSSQWRHFRQLGCHFVNSHGKNNMDRLLAICLCLSIPVFVVVDGDSDKAEGKKDAVRANQCISNLCNESACPTFPDDTYWGTNLVMWSTNISKCVQQDCEDGEWDGAEKQARDTTGLQTGKSKKNVRLISATIEILHEGGNKLPTLEKLCESMLAYAESCQQ